MIFCIFRYLSIIISQSPNYNHCKHMGNDTSSSASSSASPFSYSKKTVNEKTKRGAGGSSRYINSLTVAVIENCDVGEFINRPSNKIKQNLFFLREYNYNDVEILDYNNTNVQPSGIQPGGVGECLGVGGEPAGLYGFCS